MSEAKKQNIFNPSLFKAPTPTQEESGTDAGETSENSRKEYPVTNNASRDGVRKLLYEAFQGDKPVQNEVLSIA